MKKVRDILSEQPHAEVYSLVPDQSVLSAAQYMRERNIGAVPVLLENRLVGVVSERDMLKHVLGPGLDPRDIYVEQIMSKTITTVTLEETWQDCLTKMTEAHCRHLPVLDNGRLIGMISLREVLGLYESEQLDTYLWDRSMRWKEPANV